MVQDLKGPVAASKAKEYGETKDFRIALLGNVDSGRFSVEGVCVLRTVAR